MNNPCGNNDCNKINSGIDKCIQPLVIALNDCGIETVASCCGHGRTNGNIALKDGRELLIAPNYETARKIEKMFPDIHGDSPARDQQHNSLTGEWEDAAPEPFYYGLIAFVWLRVTMYKDSYGRKAKFIGWRG